ncbi:hypothetical protein DFR50_105189 [Roseiarcus fermentans]|uniref:DUF2059 domain-containing protein n=1 Tax=Roseiarcus fermentans TaxID=1473586 RepID=A0A366FQW9_9HYPH|nr:DUF2059 domain-containing protein [Roseiarcus fermentans]RBP16546.1 hypothetical protein DFR50_105189 [Roseiarcus fermentans]
MFATRTLSASILACALLGGAAALAADAGAPASPTVPPPSPAAVHAADQLLIAMGVKESIAKTVPTMMSELERNVLTTRPELKQSLEASLLAIKPEFDKSAQQTYGKAEALLALSLSEKDLVDVAAFFTSPLGQKYLALEPIFFGKLQDVVGPWRQELSGDIVAKAREDMKKKGVDF